MKISKELKNYATSPYVGCKAKLKTTDDLRDWLRTEKKINVYVERNGDGWDGKITEFAHGNKSSSFGWEYVSYYETLEHVLSITLDMVRTY